jgi:hypothetical protein
MKWVQLRQRPDRAVEHKIFRVLAQKLFHPNIARGAYRAAVEQYPKSRIRLRQRALIMEEHVPRDYGA